jgi:hypothetical protein
MLKFGIPMEIIKVMGGWDDSVCSAHYLVRSAASTMPGAACVAGNLEAYVIAGEMSGVMVICY